MIKIYAVLSNDNNNERDLCCFKEEIGQNIEKPLEHGEGGQGEEVPKCLTDLINSFAKKLAELSKEESSLVIIEI